MIAHIADGREQTVKEHLDNVSELCGDYAAKIGCRDTGRLISLLHDPGKFTKFFENYIRESCSGVRRAQKPNHSAAGAKIIMKLLSDHPTSAEIFSAQAAAECVACHHGGLCDNLNALGEDEFAARLSPKSEIFLEEVKENLNGCGYTHEYLNHLFSSVCGEMSVIANKIACSGLDRQYAFGILEKYLFSCLIDADRYDTMCFEENIPISKQKNNQPLWERFSAAFEDNLSSMDFSSDLNKLRNDISTECCRAAERETGIYTLSCPTGSGKTLSSLRFAVNHAKLKNKDRIFYIIPYITILDQSAKEVKENLSSGKVIDPIVMDSVSELHSAIVQFDESEQDTDNADFRKASLLTERMDSPIVMTTMVRFLNTFFGGGTRNPRPIHNFANSVIVFDEIQTIPVKCINLFNGLINFLSKICGATIVLSTATQPLLDKVREPVRPVIFSDRTELSGCSDSAYMKFKRVNLVPILKPGGYSPDELASLIVRTAESEGNALAVFNTKASVMAVYKEADEINKTFAEAEKFHIYYLTTDLCPAHRKKQIEEIKKALCQRKRIIVISSQLIEAGVNISFNCVFRALAGFDSIVQAAGRCNRHAESELKNVYIVNPAFEDLSKLPDIRCGAECAERILREFDKNKAYFNGDLLSPKTVETYFSYYLEEQKDKMSYTVKIGSISKTLYELLSSNNSAYRAYLSAGGKNQNLILRQAFKTAADFFEPIDEYARSVIVPYDKGKDIIARLNGKIELGEAEKLIRRAQQYSVNISETKFRELGKAVFPLGDTGAFALVDGYYDDSYGVVAKPRMELYNT